MGKHLVVPRLPALSAAKALCIFSSLWGHRGGGILVVAEEALAGEGDSEAVVRLVIRGESVWKKLLIPVSGK